MTATLVLLVSPVLAIAQEVLSSWNDGAARKAIVDFVIEVTKDGAALL
ncbi:hypothetical protein ACQKGL_18835 [Ensifer adhaerens]